MTGDDDVLMKLMARMDSKFDDLHEKVDKLQAGIMLIATFEERLISFKETAGRINEDMKSLRNDVEARLRLLESAYPINKLISSWIFMVIIGVMGTVGGAVLTLLLRH